MSINRQTSLRGASATRQSIKIFTATLAKTATRFGEAVNALRPLRALRCDKNWMTRTGRVMAVLILLSFFPMQVWGCQPAEPIKLDIDSFILQSENIALAHVVSAKVIKEQKDLPDVYNQIEYKFEVREIIKGNFEQDFTHIGRPIFHSLEASHFEHHRIENFWNIGAGRTAELSCWMGGESFIVGKSYLLVGDINNTYPKKAELIFHESDKWLQYVRDKVREQAAND